MCWKFADEGTLRKSFFIILLTPIFEPFVPKSIKWKAMSFSAHNPNIGGEERLPLWLGMSRPTIHTAEAFRYFISWAVRRTVYRGPTKIGCPWSATIAPKSGIDDCSTSFAAEASICASDSFVPNFALAETTVLYKVSEAFQDMATVLQILAEDIFETKQAYNSAILITNRLKGIQSRKEIPDKKNTIPDA